MANDYDTKARNVAADAVAALAVRVALHTGDPGAADTASNEVTGGSYARGTIAFAAASAGKAVPTGDVAIAVPAGNTITWISLWNSAGTSRYLKKAVTSEAFGNDGTYTVLAATSEINWNAAGRVLVATQANTTATRTFPSLSGLTKNAGDLLIAFVVGYQSSLTSNIFGTWGGGFTELKDIGVASQHCIGVAYKWSTGSETGTFTVAQAGTVTGHAAFILLSIPGAHATSPPEILAALATGTSTAADPASLTASWGADDNLWVVLAGCGETGTGGAFQGLAGAGGGAPANYGNNAPTGISADAVGGIEGGAYFRQLNAASENVGPISPDTSNARNCATVLVIRPVAAEAHSGNFTGTGGGTAVVGATTTRKVGLVAAGGGTAVAAAATTRAIALVGTGGGTAVATAATERATALVAAGGGTAVLDTATDRQAALVATGGGVAVIDGLRDEGGEEHSGAFAATGGGVAVIGATTDRAADLVGRGGGAATLDASTVRADALVAAGGGTASIDAATARQAALVGTGGGTAGLDAATERVAGFVATGGGGASLSVASARQLAAAFSGGGVMVVDATSARFGDLVATGGGTAIFTGTAEEVHSGGFVATGGGTAAFGVTTGRTGHLVATGGGDAILDHRGAHTGGFVATGGGSATFASTAPDEEPEPEPELYAATLEWTNDAGDVRTVTGVVLRRPRRPYRFSRWP